MSRLRTHAIRSMACTFLGVCLLFWSIVGSVFVVVGNTVDKFSEGGDVLLSVVTCLEGELWFSPVVAMTWKVMERNGAPVVEKHRFERISLTAGWVVSAIVMVFSLRLQSSAQPLGP